MADSKVAAVGNIAGLAAEKAATLRLKNIPIFRPITYSSLCLQCFDAVGWAAGRASGL